MHNRAKISKTSLGAGSDAEEKRRKASEKRIKLDPINLKKGKKYIHQV